MRLARGGAKGEITYLAITFSHDPKIWCVRGRKLGISLGMIASGNDRVRRPLSRGCHAGDGMTYRIYGAAGSGSVPVEAALTLIGAPYEVAVEAPTWEGDHQRDKVAPVNPMRQLPVLITPEGEVMTESAAILTWLAERHPQARLAPTPGDPGRGQFLRWMSFIPASIYSLYWVRDAPARLVGDDPTAQARVLERSAERIAECWRIMDRQVSPGRFLTGDAIGVLDLYVAVASRWRPMRRRFYREAPRMAEVVRRVDALPELQAFWAARYPFEPGWEGEDI